MAAKVATDRAGIVVDSLLVKGLIAAFTAWAGVVAWGVAEVTARIEAAAAAQAKALEKLNEYTVTTERRLATLEETTKANETRHALLVIQVDQLRALKVK